MKRHRWKYPVAYTLPREGKPATCACGAVMFFVSRRKRDSAFGSGRIYGNSTEDAVIVIGGKRLVNPSPVPGCPRP